MIDPTAYARELIRANIAMNGLFQPPTLTAELRASVSPQALAGLRAKKSGEGRLRASSPGLSPADVSVQVQDERGGR